MPTCPNGHQSGSDDWCEVCGHRMAGPGASAGAAPQPPRPGYGYPGPGGDPHATAQAELCPQCRTPREAMAPFCEECRYNFLTHTATSYTPIAPAPHSPSPGLNLPSGFTHQPPPPGPGPQGPPPGPRGPGHDPYEYQGSRPSQLNRPAEPLGERPGQQPFPPGPPSPFPQGPGQHSGGPAQHPGGPDQHGAQGQHGAPGRQGGPGQHPGPGQGHQNPPPGYPQQSAPLAPPQRQRQQPGVADDWMISPPSQSQHQSPQPQPPSPSPQSPSPQPHSQQPQHQHQSPPQHPFPQSGPSSPFPQGPGQHHGGPGQQGQGQGGQGGPGSGSAPGQHQSPPSYPAADGWTAVVAPDRDYFLAMMQRSGPDATGLNLPAYSPEQHLTLTGSQITIGRRRHSTGESPDIDLSVPPEDPGVSHKHAVLVQQPDSTWAVVDQNSTNGTTINGAEEPIQPYVPVTLNDGDRVHVGAWTTITVRRS
ncbi:FHA domain-containing protein [Streptomyces sp. NPDC001889]